MHTHWLATQVWPNVFASLIWATPAFVAQHVLLRRHITRTHQGGPRG